ncbi:hypothetical protein BDR26DRAFT_1006322 [Obelidium mucronatum]|nr:hypothetical protein BDR26DRAFT_1006322 [Obelidium mucronatum]
MLTTIARVTLRLSHQCHRPRSLPVVAYKFTLPASSNHHRFIHSKQSTPPADQTSAETNGLRNTAIPFDRIQLIGPKKGETHGVLSLAAAIAIKGTGHDIVVVDSSKTPPLCRIVLTNQTDKLLTAAQTAAKLLAAPKNKEITAVHPQVYLVGVGLTSSSEALKQLKPGQDLVLVSVSKEKDGPPACKIVDRAELVAAVDLGKKAYKHKSHSSPSSPATTKSHKAEVKDIEIKSTIGQNDLNVKVKKCGTLVMKGYSVQLKLNDTLKNPKRAAEILSLVKKGLTDGGIKFEITEIAKVEQHGASAEEQAVVEKDKHRTLYMIRGK